MPVYNTLQFVTRLSADSDREAAIVKLRDRLDKAGFTEYEGTAGSVRDARLLTPPGRVLWGVVEEIDAPDPETALADLSTRLTRAGFLPYASPRALVDDDYELAFLSENQPDLENLRRSEQEKLS
jgi:hypothetical protein